MRPECGTLSGAKEKSLQGRKNAAVPGGTRAPPPRVPPDESVGYFLSPWRAGRNARTAQIPHPSLRWLAWLAACLVIWPGPARGTILWSDLGATLVHETGVGSDILGGAVKRDDSASDILYFKFHADPLSDVGTEEYFAGFQFYEGDAERLGVGNSQGAWAYSAFKTAETGEMNKAFGDVDLHSLRRESSAPGVFLPYELPRRGLECTMVVKVQYVAGGDDMGTVWVTPHLGPGATEAGQAEGLTTRFRANASFNEIHLRHGGGGGGWSFSDLAVATAFSDFVSGSDPQPGQTGTGAGRSGLPLSFRIWQRAQ